ncbi:F-box/FBD/LRR-repeat protein [Pyrus ussuriensis x Pyrus communis]|uniref:F-box/FBD/LRR-repeat protein n=1 Tax=Pyrus ussuriensis x Pyrus communis TaxID=2448454 RepID=A0A5N5HVC6_9ROSA|nr:F-box/FBD/LRR-repeat protein [Pyrus ussuriensis x Pyrus communis]
MVIIHPLGLGKGHLKNLNESEKTSNARIVYRRIPALGPRMPDRRTLKCCRLALRIPHMQDHSLIMPHHCCALLALGIILHLSHVLCKLCLAVCRIPELDPRMHAG